MSGRPPPDYLPKSCRRVGVFVDSDLDCILECAKTWSLDVLQLHGDESPSFCDQLSEAVPELSLIKAFRVDSKSDLEKTNAYEGKLSYFLFDTSCAAYGGSGRSFDWALLQQYRGSTPFFLSGGIGPEKLEVLTEFHHPLWQGIDLNSRFETAPCHKDVKMLRNFIQKFKNNQDEQNKRTFPD